MNVSVELHGIFDLFALTFHVFDLWCASNDDDDDDDDRGRSCRELENMDEEDAESDKENKNSGDKELHSNNKYVQFRLNDQVISVPKCGITAYIIDFTMSRLEQDDRLVYVDLSGDPTLFQSQGDYQFDIYRRMKSHNQIIATTGQIRCWRRLYFLLGRLFKAGVISYPIPTFSIDHENGRANTLSRYFYLLDWSKLHGTFDLFALTFHVFDLWCASNDDDDDDDRGRSCRELCILLHSLNDLVSNFTSVIPKVPPSKTGTLKIQNETTVNGNNNKNNNDDVNEDNKTTEPSLKLNQSTLTPSGATMNQSKRRLEAVEESIAEDNNNNKTRYLQMNDDNNNDDNKNKVKTTESLLTTHRSTLPPSKRKS
ncbi:unnamed protein product [Trichobilharzia szidati]|nr:unnamed protein product [Trichobilharzia szidati]